MPIKQKKLWVVVHRGNDNRVVLELGAPFEGDDLEEARNEASGTDDNCAAHLAAGEWDVVPFTEKHHEQFRESDPDRWLTQEQEEFEALRKDIEKAKRTRKK